MPKRLQTLYLTLVLALLLGSFTLAAQASAPGAQPVHALYAGSPTPTAAPRLPSGDAPAADQPAPAAPEAACVPNLLQDPGFEAGSPNPAWGESFTTFGSPICSSLAACGTSSFIAPRSGSAWAWFGGTAGTEMATLSQTVTFPASTASLQFYLWVGSTGSNNNIFSVNVDSTTVFTATGAQASSYVTYTLVSREVSGFADGAAHTVSFNVSTTGQIENFNLDDVALCSGTPADQFLPLLMKPTSATADLSVSRVEVIQGTTMSDAYTIQVRRAAGPLPRLPGPR